MSKRNKSAHPRFVTPVGTDGRTEQSHADDTNINVIMKRALRGQHSPYIRDDPGSYGDATSLTYFEAQTLVAEANSNFAELPSHIRSRFKNSPEQFLEFIHDDANTPEAIKLGLIQPPPTLPDVPETLEPEPSPPKKEE